MSGWKCDELCKKMGQEGEKESLDCVLVRAQAERLVYPGICVCACVCVFVCDWLVAVQMTATLRSQNTLQEVWLPLPSQFSTRWFTPTDLVGDFVW